MPAGQAAEDHVHTQQTMHSYAQTMQTPPAKNMQVSTMPAEH